MNRSFIFTRKLVEQLGSRPAEIFVFLALIFGSLFIFKLAPLNGTDEFTHFPRAYQISEGHFFERKMLGNQYGGYLPANVNNMVNAYRNLSRESPGPGYVHDTHSLNAYYGKMTKPGKTNSQAIFTSVIIYPPWAYVAPLVGLVLAKILHLPLIWYIYLARISALLVWIFLTWLAIRVLPGGKWFMLALALLPTSLTQAATISADGLLNGLCWLLIALVLASIVGTVKLSWPKLLLMTVLAVFIALIKDGYFLIGLFPLAIPLKNFASKAKAVSWKIFTLIVSVGAMILFTLRTVRAVAGVVLTPTIGMYFNSNQQLSYIIHHWLIYIIRVLWQPFTKSFDTTYLGIVGIITNRLIYLSILLMSLLFSGLILNLVNTSSIKELVTARHRLWLYGAGIFIGTYVLLATAFYIGNTSVGAQYVNGFYGRYFLPLIPLLLLLPMSIERKRPGLSPIVITATLAISSAGLISAVLSLA